MSYEEVLTSRDEVRKRVMPALPGGTVIALTVKEYSDQRALGVFRVERDLTDDALDATRPTAGQAPRDMRRLRPRWCNSSSRTAT